MEVFTKTLPSHEKPWMQFFDEKAKSAVLEKRTIYTQIRSNNEDHPDDIAMNYFGNRISYGKLLREADRAAGAFYAAGVRQGDIVAAINITIPEMVYAFYGLNKLGAAPLMIDPRTGPSGALDFIKKSSTNILVVLDLYFEATKDVLLSAGLEKIIVISPDTSLPASVRILKKMKNPSPKVKTDGRVYTYKDFALTGDGVETPTAPYREGSLAAVTLTGGTTGAPKGVMLSDDGFNAIALSFMHCGVTYTRGRRFMNIIPMYASYGIVASLHMPLSLGLEIVVIPKFDQEKVGHYIKKYRPEHTLMVPSHYEKLMNSKQMRNGFDLSFFKTAGSGGDTMNLGLEEKLNNFLKEHGCAYPLSQGYGMSEASSAVSCCCNGNFKSQSVGYPLLTTTLGIFAPGTDTELGYDEEGEICMSGPAIMLGYLNNKEETDKVLRRHSDGTMWVHSGDLGRMDSDGFVYIKGRIKRMIILFYGHKVYPTHVESVLSKHKNVLACAVVGIRDWDHAQGQRPIAVIETDIKDPEALARMKEELFSRCKEELENTAIPYEICFIDSLPETGMGKIDYKKLSDIYANIGNHELKECV